MRRLEKASFVLGLLMLSWLIREIGPARVGRNLADLGWGFALLFVLQAVPYLFLTISWRLMLPPGHGVPLTVLWRMLVSCEAINAVSPVAVVGGELMRVSLLSRRVPAEDAVSSVTLAAMTQFCAQILFVLSGVPIALGFLPAGALHEGLVVIAEILAALLVALLFLGFSPAAHRWFAGAADRSSVVRAIARRIPPAWSEAIPRSASALRERPGRFAMSIGASLLYWQMGALETYLILRLPPCSGRRRVGVRHRGSRGRHRDPALLRAGEDGDAGRREDADLPGRRTRPREGPGPRAHPPNSRARLGRRRPGAPGCDAEGRAASLSG